MKQELRSAFFEALFVVFGVLLALGANEWRQRVNADELASHALTTIVAELKSNQEIIASSLEYHQTRVELLHEKLAQNQIPDSRDFPRGYINAGFISHTAWEVAQETGALVNMDYQTVLMLSASYDRLSRYKTQSEMAGEVIYKKLFEEGPQSITNKPANLLTIIYTFVYREQQLIEDMTKTLTAVD